MYIHVELGIYYDFIPPENSNIKTGTKGDYYQKLNNVNCETSCTVISTKLITPLILIIQLK
ncbi:hypothetical protein GCM10011384_11790 [Psychrobacillus lasiicapitis]|nr:hypothetical protein GCM10011384_11790 [Psychrobacillus lasiicapitis]